LIKNFQPFVKKCQVTSHTVDDGQRHALFVLVSFSGYLATCEC